MQFDVMAEMSVMVRNDNHSRCNSVSEKNCASCYPWCHV